MAHTEYVVPLSNKFHDIWWHTDKFHAGSENDITESVLGEAGGGCQLVNAKLREREY